MTILFEHGCNASPVTVCSLRFVHTGGKGKTRGKKGEPSWGCCLFAPRVTKIAEDAMQEMPLPGETGVYERMFAALSALCLWLKRNGVQVCP